MNKSPQTLAFSVLDVESFLFLWEDDSSYPRVQLAGSRSRLLYRISQDNLSFDGHSEMAAGPSKHFDHVSKCSFCGTVQG
jgi:hypothetical protein